MKKALFYISIPALALATAGCIKNDIPYPRIQPNFLTFNVEGQTRGTAIDSATRSVTVYLPETVDIYNVNVSDYTLSPGASMVSGDFSQPINLSKPYDVVLHLYQDWTWRITASQEIERYFTVSGQVGTSVIDVPGRRVVASVTKKTSLSSVLVESIKLGAEGSTMLPDLEGKHVDFTNPVKVEVTEWGRTSIWTIFVEQSESDITTERIDAWTNVAWVYGSGEADKTNGVEYRIKGDTEWTKVSQNDIVSDGGSFYARILHLSPATTYEGRVYSDDIFGETIEFTTGTAAQVPNSSLDDWWLDGKIWNPWTEGGEQYWDTGNKGATTLGASNSVPTDDTSSGQGWAAKLETKFIGIGALGKLAAGNLFAGRYVKTEGTNGILSFGRPFTQRPTKMRGYFKYNSSPINYVSSEWTNLKGQPDSCIVWVALIDSDQPCEIRTNPKNRKLFDENDPEVIAYGKMEYGQTVTDYIPFEFELEYKSTSRIPKYILITASASKYGDYFTGGTGSILYLDDLQLLYDY